MKKTISYNLLIVVALLFGCRKVELEPVDGTPVFTAEAKFNDNLKSWQAGVDGYYMFSSFEKDPLDVYEFSGSFAQKDSLDDGEIFTIKIRDNKQRPQELPDINAALEPNLYFASESDTMTIWKTIVDTIGYDVTFNASNSIIPNTPVSYEWTFGDGASDSISGQSTQHTYAQLPSESVTLSISSLNNTCSSSLTKPLNTQANTTFCDINLDAYFQNPVGDSIFIVKAIATFGAAPFAYNWSNGSTTDSLSLLLSNGNVQASVTITDANGCIVSGAISTTYVPGTVPPICIAQFSNSPVITLIDSTQVIDTIIVGDMIQLSGVKVEYTDIVGNFYSSYLKPQPSFSFFKVINIEDYDKNEKGEKTKKVTVEYNCRIYSESGDYIDLKNGKAVIAVAHP
ncbi:MAG: hypothetical protein GC192_20595 [Bacteroidetes bacterium]|nr:hypothetical protein [Bacteroidota bacterium]